MSEAAGILNFSCNIRIIAKLSLRLPLNISAFRLLEPNYCTIKGNDFVNPLLTMRIKYAPFATPSVVNRV